jgi:hypothetical protein
MKYAVRYDLLLGNVCFIKINRILRHILKGSLTL